MNCHNGEMFLKEAIESILNQSYQNFELIFYNNFSHDNSKLIINSFKDQRIKYYESNKMLTLSKARINAWKEINGEYVAILDTDDVAKLDRLSTQIQYFLKDKNLAVLGGNCAIINEAGKTLYHTDFMTKCDDLTNKLSYSFPFNNASLMFRKRYVDSVGGYPKEFTMINDYVLVYKLSKNYSIKNTNKCISKNRIHKKNLTYKNHVQNLIEQYQFLLIISEDLKKSKDYRMIRNNKIYRSRYYIKIIFFLLLNMKFKKFILFLKKMKIYHMTYFVIKVKL